MGRFFIHLFHLLAFYTSENVSLHILTFPNSDWVSVCTWKGICCPSPAQSYPALQRQSVAMLLSFMVHLQWLVPGTALPIC